MPPLPRKILPWLALALMVGFYGLMQVRSFTPGYSEVDPDGYLWLAKRIARGRSVTVRREDPFRFHSHVWVQNHRGRLAVKFSPGYPVLLAGAFALGGDEAMFWVSPVMGALALVGAFMLLRLWVPTWVALLGVATLVANRMFLYYNGYLLTHAGNLCFATWGMYFLWRWYRRPTPHWGTGAGLCLGLAVAMRYTSALLMLAVGVALVGRFVADRGRGRYHVRSALALVLSSALVPVLLAAWNDAVYGGIFITGYSLSGEQGAFGFDYLLQNYGRLLGGMNAEVLPFIFPLGLIGIIALGPWPERSMRMAWFLPLYLIYAAYYWSTPSQAYYRFLIVTMPLLVGSAYAFLGRMDVTRSARVVAICLLCAIIVACNVPVFSSALAGDLYGANNRQIARMGRELPERLEPDAVILTRRPFTFYVGTRCRFRLYDLDAFSPNYGRSRFRPRREPEEGEKPRTERKPRRQPERNAWFRAFYEEADREELSARLRGIIEEALAEGRQVAALVRRSALPHWRERMGDGLTFEEISSWEVKWRYWGRRRGEEWVLLEITSEIGGDRNAESEENR